MGDMPTGAEATGGPARVANAAVMADRLGVVLTKVSPPPLRSGLVDRPVLVDPLLATDASVVLISAPPGYGKTTALSLWRSRDERPFAWVSLDEADNDPKALLSAVATALTAILDLDTGLAERGLDSGFLPDDGLLPGLVNACVTAQRPFVLVLDDLHMIHDRDALHAIAYLADRLPDGCCLALATRTDPALPIATWRMHRRLHELRAADLAYSVAEAGAVLEAMDSGLPDQLVDLLVRRTEGWPAGIYLAALSLRGRSDPRAFVDAFTGTTRHVADVLSQDVLAQQSEEIRSFLLQTSILEELTPPLCDAVTGRTDADLMLPELERSNLFVVPLVAGGGRAYRYHHLFAQYLRAELAHQNSAVLPTLHRRACGWYREHARPGRAIAHAHAARDDDTAADLVAANYFLLAEQGYVETLRAWLRGFSAEQIAGHPPLAIAAAWVHALSGEAVTARRYAEAAHHGTWEGPMPDGSASLQSALAIMDSAFGQASVTRMKDVAAHAVELEPSASRHRAIASQMLGIALVLHGDLDDARAMLTEAVELATDRHATRSLSLTHLALLDHLQGRDEQAIEQIRQAYAVVDTPGMRTDLGSVGVYSLFAYLMTRHQELESAAEAADRATALLPRLTPAFWWLMVEARIFLAPALVHLGRAEEAAARLKEAAVLLDEHPDAGVLPDWHREATRSLHPRRRAPSTDDLSDAERRVLRLLPSELTLREIGEELCLSVNTVKTHTHAIYRKLGVSSRPEAVAATSHARRIVSQVSPG
jgi:LuxR family maltose regulon positive regulatory protein